MSFASRDLPRKLHKFSVDRWIISAVIPTLPGWFAILIRYYGETLGFVSEDEKKLQPSGIVAFTLVFLLCTSFALVKSWVDKWDVKVRNNSVDVLQRLLSSVNAVTSAKLERFNAFIRDNKGHISSPFHAITQPIRQIEQILENLRSALGQIHDIGIDRIAVSLVCKHGHEWSWLARVNCVGDLELPDLGRAESTFYSVMIEKRGSTAFYPDKRIARERNHYILSAKDQQYGGVGSIIVRDLTIKADNEVLPVALAINTYGIQLCPADDEEAKKRVLEIVLPCFESRLLLELCLYYIKGQVPDVTKPPDSEAAVSWTPTA